jgi:signal transduction histidine kinase
MNSIMVEDRENVKKLWLDLVHDAIPMHAEIRFNTIWIDQNGNKGDTWVLASAFPEKGEDGKVDLIFGSITDISQQKWAEHFEKRRMEEAVEMKRQQENFIDITSHEMRNPLSAILQCSDEITTSLTDLQVNNFPQGATEELVKNAIDASGIIALCAQHQKRIVDDILTLSKLDSALLLVTPCDVQPMTVVQRALKMFDGEVHTADIKLNFHVDRSIQKLGVEWVRLDPSRLLQVLINLTTNAIKFTTTQEKRVINVTLAASLERPNKEGDIVSYFPTRSKRKDLTKSPEWGTGNKVFLHFAVQDTGRGLTDDEKKLLFIRFSQTSPRTHVQYGGSGLGLFISRELVELQGGEIGVASKAGEGSTFAFYIKARRSIAPKDEMEQFPGAGVRKSSTGKYASLPTLAKSSAQNVESTQTSTTSSSSPQRLASKDTLKILIVEDNLVNQKVLSRQLKNLGCVVHIANHGGECLDRLRESTFWKGKGRDRIEISVVLMDQEMPVMDGLTCTKEIRRLEASGDVTSHVPIIAVTANARSEQIDTALDVGMVSFRNRFLPRPM